jgi:HSP20 family protein
VLDRLWDTFIEERPRRKAEALGEWFPLIDISETKNEIVVKAEIPGMDPKDINIPLNSVCDNGEIYEHGISWNIRVR